MRVRESSATALVRCSGLAMICINPEGQRGEIGFIREDQHVLTLSILRPCYQDGTNDSVSYREVVKYSNLYDEDVQVEIRAQGAVAGCETYTDGTEKINRQSCTDLNDFRWLVSMAELHGESPLNVTSEHPYSLTKVHLYSGLFYTHQLEANISFEKVLKDANGAEGTPEEFGRVAETLGVQIDGEEVTLSIRIGEMQVTHSLPRVAGLPSIIELNNAAPGSGVYSDMPEYYNYIVDPSGDQFELRPSWRARNQQDFCHPVVVPVQSLDELTR